MTDAVRDSAASLCSLPLPLQQAYSDRPRARAPLPHALAAVRALSPHDTHRLVEGHPQLASRALCSGGGARRAPAVVALVATIVAARAFAGRAHVDHFDHPIQEEVQETGLELVREHGVRYLWRRRQRGRVLRVRSAWAGAQRHQLRGDLVPCMTT